jgi:hypothetical protein
MLRALMDCIRYSRKRKREIEEIEIETRKLRRALSRHIHDLCEERSKFVLSSRGSGDCKYSFPDGRLFYWNEFELIYDGAYRFFIVPAADNGYGYGAEMNQASMDEFIRQIKSYPKKGIQLQLFAK